MLDILLRVQMFGFAGFVLDKVDNSVTRSDPYFRELFKRCGLYILSVKVNVQTCQCYLVTWHSLSNHSFIWSLQMKQDQNELPKELFAVKMYALVTSQPKMQNSGKRRRPKNKPRMIRSWKMPVLGVLMDQLICTVMYYYLFVSVSRTSVLQSQFCFIYIFFLYKLKFSLRSSQLMLYHLFTVEIHDVCSAHVHIIQRGTWWSSESNWHVV
jgi:hypothetical protein